ncbi:MAG: DUF6988 family protein, partial [Terriglobia bacterium]
MNAETTENLYRVERAIQEAKRVLAKHGYPDTLRTVVVVGLIDQMMEHHEAALLLVRNGKVGSAFALERSIFESAYRGLWFNYCATDAEIQHFEQHDELPLNMTDMARAIDIGYQAHGFYDGFRNRAWHVLCSYTHTGMLQLGRRFTGHDVKPQYSDEEICEATAAVTTCILLLVGKFLAVQGHDGDC